MLYPLAINNTKTNKYNIDKFFVLGDKTALLVISCQRVIYMNKSGV